MTSRARRIDGGFPIDVVSDYLPVQLLNRSRVGEFDT